MQAKHLIIIAIIGILGLIAFNWMISAKTKHAIEATQQSSQQSNQPASQPTAATAPPVPVNNGTIGNQPKATLDKVNTQINQANQAAADNMAAAETAT